MLTPTRREVLPAVLLLTSGLLTTGAAAQNGDELFPIRDVTGNEPTARPVIPLDDEPTTNANSREENPGSIISVFGDLGLDDGRESEAEQTAAGGFSQITFATVGADFDPDVSPDGSFMVFASTQHRPTADIYIKSNDANVITQITNDPGQDVMPAISPDGNRIAFASNRSGNWDIYVMPTAGGKAVQISTDVGHELHPSWSPDGSELVFCRLGQMSGRWELWVVNVQSPNVSHFIGYGLFPEWCPQAGTGLAGADRILFQRSRERDDFGFGIWTIDYSIGQAGSPTQLADNPDAAFINPTWSPDGSRVVFASIDNPENWNQTLTTNPETADLWMVGVDGTGLVNLTAGGARDLMPVWGADERIYFVSARDGQENIWAFDAGPALLAATGTAANPNTYAQNSVPAPSVNTQTATAADVQPQAPTRNVTANVPTGE
ncbi:MAG: DPP IV N-terminal domain-containing protein [Planctomycetota bacterium]